MKERIPAEIFPPGDFIREEMEERGWSLTDMAYHSVLPEPELQAILDGGRITGSQAEHIGFAFGTSAIVWANLSMAYQKWRPRP